MDNQSQPPAPSNQVSQKPSPQPAVAPTQALANGNQQHVPKPALSDSAAQDLLLLNNLHASQQPKNKPPVKLVIAVLAMIALALLTSSFLGSVKPGSGAKTSSSSGLGLPNQADPRSGSDVTKQINQDVNTCTNPVNATLAC